MRRWGMTMVAALATAVALVLTASSAIAATPIAVTETTDAPLEAGASTCESTDTAKGCTLRAAVELADNEGVAATIDVPEGTYQETAAEPTLVVKDDVEVTISGAGAEKTTIEGDATASVLEVENGSSLTLDGVTVTNGEDEDGGGVYVAPFADLTVENSTITENLATEYGGAIFGYVLSHIVVKGSTIVENLAESDGGGIATEEGSYVSVQGSQITENRAGESGGGLTSGRDSVVTVDKSTIAKNEAEYEGGGVAAYMAEFFCSGHRSQRPTGVRRATDGDETEPELTVDQSTIEHNSAKYGGGIFTYEEQGECDVASTKTAVKPQTALFEEPNLSIDQSTIAYNRAEERDEDGGYGGGIYEEGFFEDPITNSTIADNFATNDGGGAAIADGASAALVSDTVFDNTVEPQEIEIQGRSARRAIHRDVIEGTVGPGSNLATEEDAYVGLRNTIVAEPSASVENCEGNFESLVEKAGYNLDYPSKALSEGTLDSCGMSVEEQDLVGVAPGLDEEAGLASNGGPTQTIALLSSSPAIGFVPVAEDCEAEENGPASIDQRGEPRPGIVGKGCDIGAYEYQGPSGPSYSLSLSPPTGEQEAGESHMHSVTATVTEEGAPTVITRAVSGNVTPVPDAELTFTITGQNDGVTGTCSTPEGTSDPNCETNSEGKVVFTYADKKGSGKDTIGASVELGGKKQERAASMTWTAPPATTALPATTAPQATIQEAKKEVLSIKVVSPAQCASKRDITIHIQNVKQLGIVSAVVSIDGQHKRTLRGKHLSTGIDLVGLPPGTFTVEIVARTRGGHTLKGARVYHTCHTKLPGHSYLKL
jgi:hypothetical protein